MENNRILQIYQESIYFQTHGSNLRGVAVNPKAGDQAQVKGWVAAISKWSLAMPRSIFV